MDYVLVFEDSSFFVDQNLYLGIANLTKNLKKASKLSLDEAEAKLKCMDHQDKWEIWSVRLGWILNQRSQRHIHKKEKHNLEQKLEQINQILNDNNLEGV